jgi:hypothetical protein
LKEITESSCRGKKIVRQVLLHLREGTEVSKCKICVITKGFLRVCVESSWFSFFWASPSDAETRGGSVLLVFHAVVVSNPALSVVSTLCNPAVLH